MGCTVLGQNVGAALLLLGSTMYRHFGRVTVHPLAINGAIPRIVAGLLRKVLRGM
jgi:hypothetical protein